MSRRGRTFSPPLTASGVLVLGDWVRDDLPDLLWPALFRAEQGSSTAGIQFVRFQKAVLDDVVDLTDRAGKVIEVDTVLTDCLDGSLTGWIGLWIGSHPPKRSCFDVPRNMAC